MDMENLELAAIPKAVHDATNYRWVKVPVSVTVGGIGGCDTDTSRYFCMYINIILNNLEIIVSNIKSSLKELNCTIQRRVKCSTAVL